MAVLNPSSTIAGFPINTSSLPGFSRSCAIFSGVKNSHPFHIRFIKSSYGRG